jgi:poly(A) polymerase
MKNTAFEIVKELKESGFSAFIVGGACRNILLGLTPKDFDICTNATPDQVHAIFPDSGFIGEAFGVSLVKRNGFSFEVATFRKESYDSNGDNRHPDNVDLVNNVEEDLGRRDLTVNSIIMDENEKFIDFFGGMEDIKNKIVRAIGDPNIRFKEDALRILRAVRFATVLDFTIEENTLNSIKENGFRLENISIERIREEFMKIITSPNAAKGLTILKEAGLLRFVMPELISLIGCKQGAENHPEGDVFNHTVKMFLVNTEKLTPNLALGMILHDIGKPSTQNITENGKIQFIGHEKVGAGIAVNILRRMKFDKDTINVVSSHVRNHMMFMNVMHMKKSKVVRFCRHRNFEELMQLGLFDSLASNGLLENIQFIHDFFEENTDKINATPLVNGNDLLALGFKAGAEFKKVLEKTEDAFLDDRFTTKEELLSFAEHVAKSMKVERS